MPASKRTYVGRIYLGQDADGREQYKWVGRFATKRERDEAVALARAAHRKEIEQAAKPMAETVTCDEWADAFLARYERSHKASSAGTARQALKRFRDEFGDRPIGSIERHEARAWTERVPRSAVPPVVTMFNAAVDDEILTRNPFRKLADRTRGRADEIPPTEKELQALLDACDVLGDYAPQMRNLIEFQTYTAMRPGETFELRWSDIDFKANRIHVARRLYRGRVDVPKNGKPKTIALAPPARDALMRQPTRTRDDGLVFVSKLGKRLSTATLCQMWALVRASAGLTFDFYMLKHLAAHRLWKLGLSKRAICAQCGWNESAVDGLLRIYGHTDLVALSEVDALYESPTQIPTQEAVVPRD